MLSTKIAGKGKERGISNFLPSICKSKRQGEISYPADLSRLHVNKNFNIFTSSIILLLQTLSHITEIELTQKMFKALTTNPDSGLYDMSRDHISCTKHEFQAFWC